MEPSLNQFLEALDALLTLYNQVITCFVPISKDPRIETYTTSAKFDFLTRLAEENMERSEIVPDPEWPDVNLVLSDYSPYQEVVEFIRAAITETFQEVTKLSEVFDCRRKWVQY